MVIFTSPDLKERIEYIRKDKPTKIITLELDKKFKYILKKIKNIQDSPSFKEKVSPDQIKNIEYWSNYYVLVNNLKTYFVNRAIKDSFQGDEKKQFAWVDFGYVRWEETLDGLSKWHYNFEKDKVSVFLINDISKVESIEDVYRAIFCNTSYITGGVLVGNIKAWSKFNKVIFKTQKELINSNIIDDDQGVYLTSYFNNKNLFKLHDLEGDWFGVFKKFKI